MKKTEVFLSSKANKQLKKIPIFIVEAVFIWVQTVEKIGIFETRKLAGYHDEPLRGDRKGQRSVRMNRAYRLFYEENEVKKIINITVIEVNKHEY